jgi:threonine dehydrogenase-like Zn-dependent dehydrogenase
MRRLISMVQHNRLDLTPLVTHRFSLEQTPEAFNLFSHQAAGVMKVALFPAAVLEQKRLLQEAVDVQC